MFAGAVRKREEADGLFDRIGAFLAAHRLSPDPEHYAFAHSVLLDPSGPLATAVARITDDGVRLSRGDIERLGGTARAGAPIDEQSSSPKAANDQASEAERLVAQTRAQVEGFATMVRGIRAEASEFGAQLDSTAAVFEEHESSSALSEIARVTAAMRARVRETEARLAEATRETDELRTALAEAQSNAARDPLTGLSNRRAFEQVLQARAGAVTPCAVALCDVDRFKLINDRFGHAIGDKVLSAIAQTLAEVCTGHLVVRYGGEEFAILMQGVSLPDAQVLLDEARDALSKRRLRSRDTGEPIGQITMSGGVTVLRPGEPHDDALARADKLLYAAKSDGRNRILSDI